MGVPLRVRLAAIAIAGDKVVATTCLVGPTLSTLASTVWTVLEQRLRIWWLIPAISAASQKLSTLTVRRSADPFRPEAEIGFSKKAVVQIVNLSRARLE